MSDDLIIETDDGFFARYWVPIAPDDLATIEGRLASQRLFCTSFPPSDHPAEDPYRAITYRHQTARFGTECRLLLDRNVVTRLVALASGKPAGPMHRVAAAVLAFAQCAGLVIDPGLALYELAQSQGGRTARLELAPFRALDNVHPGYLADVALERTEAVPPEEIARAAAATDTDDAVPAPDEFEKPLRDYRISYNIALRTAALALSRCPAHEKAHAFLQWLHWEYRWSPPAVWLGLRYFATRLPTPKWFSGLLSADRSKALERVRNVAWDLTLLSTWIRRVKEVQCGENVIWILCSLDAAVLEVGQAVLVPDSAEDASARSSLARPLSHPLSKHFERMYGARPGRLLHEEYTALIERRRDPARAYNRLRGRFPRSLTLSLEQALLEPLRAAKKR